MEKGHVDRGNDRSSQVGKVQRKTKQTKSDVAQGQHADEKGLLPNVRNLGYEDVHGNVKVRKPSHNSLRDAHQRPIEVPPIRISPPPDNKVTDSTRTHEKSDGPQQRRHSFMEPSEDRDARASQPC